ncbi:MAG TPA: DUF11 domain-containing protein [Verrucomicrobiae bacterium]|nr:DUF11 domain-containing protein [Verrucomicrobiae bacterium]
MKGLANLRITAAFAMALLFARVPAEAQLFSLSVTNSASSVLVSNSVTYTINVTNLGSGAQEVWVTNSFSSPLIFLNANGPADASFVTTNNIALFELTSFTAGAGVQLTLTVEPTNTVSLTNTITVVSSVSTNTTFTNVIVQVTNFVTEADLGVSITGPAQAVITNDWMTYGVNATNLGPDTASSVKLTNTLPAGVILKGISPTNKTFSTVGSNLIFNLGTLTNSGFANLQFTVQPTNIGPLTLAASIGTTSIADANLANNSASTNIVITNYFPGQLVASITSTQVYNPQNGLVEQTIMLSNVGSTSVPAARVVITGLTNELYNAFGTNDGNPFVVYGQSLDANQNVSLLLQFFAFNYFTLSNSQLQAFAVPPPNLSPPAAALSGTNNFSISRIVPLSNGNMLIEFPTIVGRTYTVVYSDNVTFSNAMIAPPSIVAPANRLQWVDYGPPTTLSVPTNTAARFYRVILNQ